MVAVLLVFGVAGGVSNLLLRKSGPAEAAAHVVTRGDAERARAVSTGPCPSSSLQPQSRANTSLTSAQLLTLG